MPIATTAANDAPRGARPPSAFALLVVGTFAAALVFGAVVVWPACVQRANVIELEKDGTEVFVTPMRPAWLRDRLSRSWRQGLGRVTEVVARGGFDNTNMSVVARLRTIQHLTLRYSKVDDEGLRHLANLRSLEGLNLDRLNVSDEGLKSIAGLDQLRFLSLDHTRVTDGGMHHIAGLKRLSWLCLEGTAVTPNGLSTLRELPELESLHLGGPAVTAEGIVVLVELPQLRTIHLQADGERRADALAALGKLDGLARLSAATLKGDAFTDEAIELIVGLSRVKRLSLCNVAISGEAVNRLRRERPRINVSEHADSDSYVDEIVE